MRRLRSPSSWLSMETRQKPSHGNHFTFYLATFMRARIIYFMLKRNKPYRGVNRGLWERKLKSMEKRALNGLRN